GIPEHFHVMLALLKGEYESASALLKRLYSIGQRRQDPMVMITYGGQLLALRGDLGSPEAGELEPLLKESVAQFPALVSARCGLALLYARAGRESEAKVEFEYLANGDFVSIPKDWNWLGSISMMAEVCAA